MLSATFGELKYDMYQGYSGLPSIASAQSQLYYWPVINTKLYEITSKSIRDRNALPAYTHYIKTWYNHTSYFEWYYTHPKYLFCKCM